MSEAILYEKQPDSRVRCNVYQGHCVIAAGKSKGCRIRPNYNGKLKATNCSKVTSAAADPVEKRPSFHFFTMTSGFPPRIPPENITASVFPGPITNPEVTDKENMVCYYCGNVVIMRLGYNTQVMSVNNSKRSFRGDVFNTKK